MESFASRAATGLIAGPLSLPVWSQAFDSQALQDAVTADSIYQHLEALQQIAGMYGGTRASGTPGFVPACIIWWTY